MTKVGKRSYIYENVYWLLLSMYWYRSIFFRSIFDFSVNQSKVVLWIWVVSFCLVSYALTDARNRTGWTIFITLLFPYELYAILTYYRYFYVLVRILSYLAATVLCVYLFCTWARPIPSHRKRLAIIKSRVRHSIYYVRSIPTFFLFPFMVVVLATLLRGGTLLLPKVDATQYGANGESTLFDNLDTICKLDDKRWEELSAQEKLDVLQVVANVERNGLGIYHDIMVQSGIMQRDSIVGEYDPVNHVITINIDHLQRDTAQETLDTVLHECYHAYQWCLAHLFADSDEQYRNLYLFADARQYVNEFENYHDGGDTHKEYEAYYYQSVELNARTYAANAVEGYFSLIELYS